MKATARRRRSGSIVLAAALAALSLAGCTTHLANCTLLSTKNVDVNAMDREKADLKDGEGSDGRFWFLFLPFGGAPSIEVAANRAMDSKDGNFMMDAALFNDFTTFLLFTWEGYTVKGDVGSAVTAGGISTGSR